MNFYLKYKTFHSWKCIWNIVCLMVVILPRGRWVKPQKNCQFSTTSSYTSSLSWLGGTSQCEREGFDIDRILMGSISALSPYTSTTTTHSGMYYTQSAQVLKFFISLIDKIWHFSTYIEFRRKFSPNPLVWLPVLLASIGCAAGYVEPCLLWWAEGLSLSISQIFDIDRVLVPTWRPW